MELGESLIDLGIPSKPGKVEEEQTKDDEWEAINPHAEEDGDVVEEEDEAEEPSKAEEPKRPKKKGINKKKVIKVLGIIGLLIGAGLAAVFLPRFVLPSRIINVTIYALDEPENEQVSFILTAETSSFSKAYNGPFQVEVIYQSSVVHTITGAMSDGDAFPEVEYDKFYRDNGEYEFRFSVEGYSSSGFLDFTKTAHYVPLTLTPNNKTQSLQVTFDLMTKRRGVSIHDQGITGNGTIMIYNGTTTIAPPLEIFVFDVQHDNYYFEDDPSMKYSENGAYMFYIPYSDFETPSVDTTKPHDYTVTVSFTNGLPTYPVIMSFSEEVTILIREQGEVLP